MVRPKATLDHRHLPPEDQFPHRPPFDKRGARQLAFSASRPSPAPSSSHRSRHRTRCGTELTLGLRSGNRKSGPTAPVTRGKEHPPARGCPPSSTKMWKVRPPTIDRLVPATSRTNIRNTRFRARVAEGQLSVPPTQLQSKLAAPLRGGFLMRGGVPSLGGADTLDHRIS
jgi:hypothetical protein